MTRMNPREAFLYIGCGYDKGMQMVRKGEIPHYRIGKKVFFIKEKLDEWISCQLKQSVGA